MEGESFPLAKLMDFSRIVLIGFSAGNPEEPKSDQNQFSSNKSRPESSNNNKKLYEKS